MLKINTPRIVHETIDGETVLLDLNKGLYFSFDGLGALLWQHIEEYGQYSTLLNSDHWTAAQKQLIADFYKQLMAEEILVEADAEFPQESASLFFNSGGLLQEFNAPTINKYSDMQDMLLLDPIHEVEKEQGWPKPLK